MILLYKIFFLKLTSMIRHEIQIWEKRDKKNGKISLIHMSWILETFGKKKIFLLKVIWYCSVLIILGSFCT